MSLPYFNLPLAAEDFLRDYWQRRPLLMRQAAGNLDLIDGDLLAGLALEEAVESRLVSGGLKEGWQLRQGPFAETDLTTLPNSYWTLLVQSVDHYLTQISLLLDSFRFLPPWRIEDIMISYAVPGGSVGPHFDNYDVFLIQGSGTRRWQIGQACDDDTPLLPHDSLKLLKDFKEEEEHLLQPGDVLYLPPGIAHWGTAESDDCITWSVGFRSPDLYQMIDWLLAESEATRQPLLYIDNPADSQSASPCLTHLQMQQLLQQASDSLQRLPCQAMLAKWLSLPRQDTLDLLGVDEEALRKIKPDAILVRHGGARMLLESETSETMWINGEPYALGKEGMPLARKLVGQRIFTEAELSPLLTAPLARNLLNLWVEQGYFYEL
jgi:50S ribosomal protein L16 3-hydroxylase